MSRPWKAGLCSVTFRALAPDEVIAAAADAGLDGVEWGGDIHLPPGAEREATELARRCADAGLACPSYGSYLCAGRDRDAGPALATAAALGAATIRVWAGSGPSSATPPDVRRRVADDLTRWCADAARLELTLSLEHHAGTLTDAATSTLDLLGAVDAANLYTYWQPRDGDAGAHDLDELGQLLPHLSHLHVFWWRSWLERFPLTDGERFWRAALRKADGADGWPHERWALLEFVRGDDPAQLVADAAALRSWLAP